MMRVIIEGGFYLRVGTINLMRALGGAEHAFQLEHVRLSMWTYCLSGRCGYYLSRILFSFNHYNSAGTIGGRVLFDVRVLFEEIRYMYVHKLQKEAWYGFVTQLHNLYVKKIDLHVCISYAMIVVL